MPAILRPRRPEARNPSEYNEGMDTSRLDIIEHLPEDLAMLLRKLGDDLRAFYGERYRGLVLYGSYARGEADEGSDVDLLLLLEGEVDSAAEIIRAESVKWTLALDSDYAVSIIPISVDDYQRPGEPFIMNARREGARIS